MKLYKSAFTWNIRFGSGHPSSQEAELEMIQRQAIRIEKFSYKRELKKIDPDHLSDRTDKKGQGTGIEHNKWYKGER